MITTIDGHGIKIDGTIEWLLFHRLTKKLNPVEFLLLTDSLVQLPNFLYTLSLLILIFINTEAWIKFAIPSGLYFFGQMMINLHFGIGDIRLIRYPLIPFFRLHLLIIPATFITCFFFLKWWTFLLISSYFLTMLFSVLILTSKEKKHYQIHWNNKISNNGIIINNAFLLAYMYYAEKFQLTKDITPTDEEINNQDWLKPYQFMRSNWGQMEEHFSDKAKDYWRAYLHIDK